MDEQRDSASSQEAVPEPVTGEGPSGPTSSDGLSGGRGAEASSGVWAPVVVLDTTVFGADLLCASTAWRVIAQATRAWGVRVVVPSVVLAKAVGAYRRPAGEAIVGLDRWRDKQRLRQLGLDDVATEVADAIETKAAEFEADLRARLTTLAPRSLQFPRSPTTSSPHAQLPADGRATRTGTAIATL